jgi:uncharacterized protein YdeI (YjbR/CyaY-like superfamily)
MPDFVKQALLDHGVMEFYEQRPPYQRNDYIGWISRAVKEETKMKRLKQMIEELKDGGLYMKMKYAAKGRKESDK